jgi:hypothetical protein
MNVEFMNYAMLRLGYVIGMSGLDTLRDELLRYARRSTGFDRYTTMLRLSLRGKEQCILPLIVLPPSSFSSRCLLRCIVSL